MKKYISLTFALVLLFSLSSCQSRESLKSELKQEILQEMKEEKKDESSVIPNDSSKGGSRESKKEESIIQESGSFIVEEYKKVFVKSHNNLVVNLIYSNSPSKEVRLEGREEIVDSAKVSLSGDNLTIDISDPRNNKFFSVIGQTETINVYIGATTLEEIRLEGGMVFKNSDKIVAKNLKISTAGILEMDGDIEADTVKIFVAGASEMDIDFIAKNIEIDSSGGIKTIFSGTAESLTINSKGATEIDSLYLEADDVTLKGAGVIEAKVQAIKTLDISVAGFSEIKYKGEPVITNSTPLLSEVKKID